MAKNQETAKIMWPEMATKDQVKRRKYQQVFLKILGSTEGPVDRGFLHHKVKEGFNLNPKHGYVILNAIGSMKQEGTQKREKRLGYPSLLTLGYVKAYTLTIEFTPTTVYEITDIGRGVLASLPSKLRWERE